MYLRFVFLPFLIRLRFQLHTIRLQVHLSLTPAETKSSLGLFSRSSTGGWRAHLVQAADFLCRVDDLRTAGALGVHPPNRLRLLLPLKSASSTKIELRQKFQHRRLTTSSDDKTQKDRWAGERRCFCGLSTDLGPGWRRDDAALTNTAAVKLARVSPGNRKLATANRN